jgi:protein-tyrosine-phosphatase
LGDFNLEIVMCLYLKANVRSAMAERILTELAKQMHPEIEQYKAAWTYLVEASKILNFIANVGLVFSKK